VALTIDNPEVDRLAHELAAKTGASVEEAVATALRQALLDQMQARIEAEVQRPPTRFPARAINLEAIRTIQDKIARLPVVDDRPADELLGYDEWGLPH